VTEDAPASTQPLITDDPTTTPWADARERLEKPQKYRTYWLSTMHPEGRPNVMPVIGLWLDDAFFFISGESTRKGRNLAANPHCALTVGSPALPALDLVIEGEAVKVTDNATLTRVARAYGSELHWPLTVRDKAMVGPGAPTAGPPPYALFKLSPTIVFGLPGLTGMDKKGKRRTDPISPTRWRF
jgi:Pyridoxamine 5'-phosphate oxidase